MSKILRDVPYLSQKGRYPTGCESISTVMCLQYLGYDILPDDFIADYLPIRLFETRDGNWYGADPRISFCGSPYEEDGFGCYAPVICAVLNRFFKENKTPQGNFVAVDETGMSVDALCRKYIDNGFPVICWTCIDLKEPIVGPTWHLLDSGEEFTWISNEHCLVVVGYDDDYFYCNDPYEGHGLVKYPRDLMEQRHLSQYAMAVGLQASL